MARNKKSVYERIEETKSQITSTEQTLVQLKSQLEELLREKDQLEMEQTWQLIKDKGLTMDDIRNVLSDIIK